MIEPNQVINGKCEEVLKDFPDNFFDSCVTDPPYGISFMNKHWDYQVPSIDTWKEILRVLKPGAHILVACGTRTQHRMAVNIEDSGFEIRDVITWHYGSGFPKSLDISKAIDKKGGFPTLTEEIATALKIAREKRGITKSQADKLFCNSTTLYSWYEGRPAGIQIPTSYYMRKIANEWHELEKYVGLTMEAEREIIGRYESDMGGLGGQRLGEKNGNITIPSTDEAKKWEGWGTGLKPATEFWTLARKPISENTIAENVLKHGTGGINIDGSRIESGQEITNRVSVCGNTTGKDGFLSSVKESIYEGNPQGRFPANVIFDEFTGKILDEQSGISQSPEKTTSGGKTFGSQKLRLDYDERALDKECFGDIGGASRFFYCPKADNYERNKGLKAFDGKYMDEGREIGSPGGTNPRNRGAEQARKNYHPTVKPIDLMRYLVKLITPKHGICLDPFGGSGTTGIGCKLELINYILIELNREYCDIATARIAAWNPPKYIEQTLF